LWDTNAAQAEQVQRAAFQAGRVVIDQEKRHPPPIMRLGIGFDVAIETLPWAPAPVAQSF